MKERQVVIEQMGDNKVAIDSKSLKNIMRMVSLMTAQICIPNDVDKDDPRVEFLSTILTIEEKLTSLALYDSESFTELLEKMNIAEVKFQTEDERSYYA